MAREIEGAAIVGDFPPMVGIKDKKGSFVKGTVLAIGSTANGNPVVTLVLIDLDGNTSISKSKGVYQEVEVKVGDAVQVIGSLTDLKDKLPKLVVGDVVTITYESDKPSKKGNPKKIFKVVVDDEAN